MLLLSMPMPANVHAGVFSLLQFKHAAPASQGYAVCRGGLDASLLAAARDEIVAMRRRGEIVTRSWRGRGEI